ncbi:cystathionine beta-lyase [Streptococcus oricebi]|uniref:Cystathionine beta-lyase n=1 Tax=Streptococcus oricebi TaxID=1547447 RepID=A0ABS5B160_9STRE|nr:cystathionine beta-lyase [Streptococcus oricebi]MBP2622559.1 cystathionine beta-lyase [Streptococcus oricebi]
MIDYLELALKYGGFTSLDKVYLTGVLEGLTEEQKLAFITPPPSVINAYFAELYQKQGPQAATDYFFELTCKLDLFEPEPDFSEPKPFVRLNLSGKSFGYSYLDQQELACVFSEKQEEFGPRLFFELAQIFPHYWVYEEQGKIYMQPLKQESVLESRSLTDLTSLEVLANGQQKISGYNQEEVLEVAQTRLLELESSQLAYGYQERKAIIYIR